MQSILKHFLLLVLLAARVDADEVDAEPRGEPRPIILLILGPPGSGRDVLAVKITNSFSLPYISTADLLLYYSDDDSETGRQALQCLNMGKIPDDLLLTLISDRVKKSDCKRGFLLDGFPKTAEQAKALKKQFGAKFRLLPTYIRTSEEWLLNMHEGRLVCTNCGRVYHQDRSPPQNEDLCDICGYDLIQRTDDCSETLKKRTESYRDTILPLLTYFSQEGLLVEIDGNRPFDEMYQDVRMMINSQQLPATKG